MPVLRHPVFLTCCGLFLLHQVLQKLLHVSLPVVDAYLDNFLGMPIILTLLLAERQWLFRRGAAYRLSLLEVTVATIYVLLLTELLFPWLSGRFTTDWRDAVFSFAGSYLFYRTINRQPSAQQSERIPAE